MDGWTVDVIRVQPHEIRVEDIVGALPRLCRFGGHLPPGMFYSVAAHSMLVASLCPERYRLEGLLHDAAEAYTGDVMKPLRVEMHGFEEKATEFELAVAERFGLRYPWPDEVVRADMAAAVSEGAALGKRVGTWGIDIDPNEAAMAMVRQFARGWDMAQESTMLLHIWKVLEKRRPA